MWLCHFPTLHQNDLFSPYGNMTGGNMLVGHDDDGVVVVMLMMEMVMMMKVANSDKSADN